MSKMVELSDEEYQALVDAAKKRHETPEQMLRSLARALADSAGALYYSLDEMFDTLDAYAAENDTATLPVVASRQPSRPMPTNELEPEFFRDHARQRAARCLNCSVS